MAIDMNQDQYAG